MPTKKPSCTDFIVAAIRATRQNPKNMKPGNAAGKTLHILFCIAKQKYGERRIRQTLNTLIKKEVLLLTVEAERNEKIYVERWRSIIPNDFCLNDVSWDVPRQDGPMVVVYRNMKLYVVADGVPEEIKKFVENKAQQVAMQIMESLQK